MQTLVPKIDFQFESLERCPICSSDSLSASDVQYNIYTCSCGFVIDNPRPTLQSIEAFYSAKGKYASWVSKEKAYNRLWQRRLKLFSRYAKKGNLLDIGAGIGQFLAIARPYFTAVYGTEVSSSGAAVAQEKFGIELVIGDIHTLSLAANSFDNITLIHLLEHVHDPCAMLERTHELLTEGGMLFVCVPNDVMAWGSRVKAFGKRLGLTAFQKFSPKFGLPKVGTSSEIHLSHFTEKSLVSAAKKAGFDICYVGLDPYFAANWSRTVPHTLYFALHSALYRLTGRNHYETILLAARKR